MNRKKNIIASLKQSPLYPTAYSASRDDHDSEYDYNESSDKSVIALDELFPHVSENKKTSDSVTAVKNIFGDRLSPRLGQFDLVVPLLCTIRGGKYKSTVDKAIMAIGATQFAWETYKQAKRWVYKYRADRLPDTKREYTLYCERDTDLADAILKHATQYVLDNRGDQSALQLAADASVLELLGSYGSYENGISTFAAKVDTRDEDISLYFEIGEHRYDLVVKPGRPGDLEALREEFKGRPGFGGAMRFHLHISCFGEDAVKALIDFIPELFEPRVRSHSTFVRRATLYTYDNKRHEWSSSYGSVYRSIDSVVLHEGQIEMITEDIKKFISLEQDYIDYGLTWRRGIMLSGPPGTGKTSFLAALASFLELDIYYVSLRDMPSNEEFISAIKQVDQKSIIAFEDVDVVAPGRDNTTNVSLDTMLNVIDGLFTPHGSIFLMTTNHADNLDPALMRPGRVDLHVELGNLNQYQVDTLMSRFLQRPVKLPKIAVDVAPAALSGVFKRHLDNREAALPEVVALITGETPAPSVIEELVIKAGMSGQSDTDDARIDTSF